VLPDKLIMPMQILLADDHEVVREGLRVLLEREGFEVIAEASDGREAITLCAGHPPDVAVLDLAMPLLNGIDAAREITKSNARVRVILLTMHTEDHLVLESLRAGVTGYVLKTRASSELVQAIRAVSRGETFLTQSISRSVVQAFLQKSEIPDLTDYVLKTRASSELVQAIRAVSRGETFLTQSISRSVVQAFLQKSEIPDRTITDRERQVLQLVAEGKTTKEIASILGISVKTAESHRSNLMDKLDIHDTAGLVRYAIRQGIIQS